MRELILKIRLSDEEAAKYEGSNAMVVPLTDAEANELRRAVLGVRDFLIFQKTVFADVLNGIEGHEAVQTGELVKLLKAMSEPIDGMIRWQVRTGHFLARAAFVGGDSADPKEEAVTDQPATETPSQKRQRMDRETRERFAQYLGVNPKGGKLQ